MWMHLFSSKIQFGIQNCILLKQRNQVLSSRLPTVAKWRSRMLNKCLAPPEKSQFHVIKKWQIRKRRKIQMNDSDAEQVSRSSYRLKLLIKQTCNLFIIICAQTSIDKREKRHLPCNNIGVCPIKWENRLTNRQTRCKHEKYRQTNKKQRKIHLACNKMALSPAEDSSSSSCATSTNLPLVPEHNHHLHLHHHHHHHLHHHHHPWIFSFSAGSPMWSRPDTFVGLTAHLIGNCKLAKCNPFPQKEPV